MQTSRLFIQPMQPTQSVRGCNDRHPSAKAGSWLIALAIGLLCLAACGPRETFNGQVVQGSPDPVDLLGTNFDGQPFSLSAHKGKVAIVFFGYTYCPDVCPYSLGRMKQLYAQLGDQAEELKVVFVSVDPHRDTLEKLSNYVPNFDPRFYGLRLDFDEIDAVDKIFNLTVQYGQPKDGPGTASFYYVDHTGYYFLLDRAGKLRVKHTSNATVEQILPDIKTLLAG